MQQRTLVFKQPIVRDPTDTSLLQMMYISSYVFGIVMMNIGFQLLAETAARDLIRNVSVSVAVAVVLAIFLAVGSIRSITRPIAQAVTVAERVAGGDLSAKILVQSHDEMGQLLRALERMQC